MSSPSRLEINFKRILAKCEAMVAGQEDVSLWRLEQYHKVLITSLADMEKATAGKPSADSLAMYGIKVSTLKNLINTKEKEAQAEPVAAVDQCINTGIIKLTMDGVSTASRQAHDAANARHVNHLRSELLQTTEKEDSLGLTANGAKGLRERRTHDAATDQSSPKEENVEEVLRVHRENQEKIANDMIGLAQQLKTSQRQAKRTILEDTVVLEKSSSKAQKNADRLQSQTDALTKHTNKACSYWVWIMILFVAITFIAMVVFIRIVPK